MEQQDCLEQFHFSGAANPRLMRVVVGQYNFDKIDPEEMAFEIESVAVHPSYQ